MTVATANDFAADGELAAGYICLVASLHEALSTLDWGDPWAAELIHRCHEAIEAYIARYGVPIE